MTSQPASVQPLAPAPALNNPPNPTNSPSHAPSRLPKKSGKRRSLVRVAIIATGVVGALGLFVLVGTATGTIKLFDRTKRADLIFHRVQEEPLRLTITERGQLESADNSDIVCRVKARSANSTVATTIRWIIDDGTQVRRGDKLVQLDDSGLYEQLKTQRITLDQAYAAWVQADKNSEIVVSQNSSDKATAKLVKELAVIDLEKYEKGDYVATLQEIEGRQLIAKSDLSMWEERSSWSERMSRPGRGYVTASQAQADDARFKSARIALSKVDEEMRVLDKFTRGRTIKDLQGKIDEARRAIDRVEAQAEAKRITADADRRSKLSVYEQETGRFSDIQDEIKKCLIFAPQSGLVVYFIPEQSRSGAGSQQSIIAQGEPVREGQKLMRIPDLSKMDVNTRVHEALISRVRGEKWNRTPFSRSVQAGLLLAPGSLSQLTGYLGFASVREEFAETYRSFEMQKVQNGQPAQVRIDAFPGRVLEGEVKTVATVASQQDWMSADVKVYQTIVSIKETIPDLKPGMSAEVVLFTDSAKESCLTVPVQAILGSMDMGNMRRVYVMTATGPEPRDVVVGLSNDKMAEIESGLDAGDQVIVNARVLLTDKEKAQYGDGSFRYRSEEKDKGKVKDKDKGKDKGKAKEP